MKAIRPPKELRLPRGHWMGPHCGITAVAIAAQVRFRDVWDLIAERKPASWGGSVKEEDLTVSLRYFGVRYRSRAFNLEITVGHWAGVHAKPGVLYILDVWDHVAVFKDGFLFDQRGLHFTVMEKGHWKIARVYEIRSPR